jgi:hypothetical protein
MRNKKGPELSNDRRWTTARCTRATIVSLGNPPAALMLYEVTTVVLSSFPRLRDNCADPDPGHLARRETTNLLRAPLAPGL